MNLRASVIPYAPKNATTEQVHSFVTALIVGSVLVEAMDACKDTPLYSQQVKNSGKTFLREVERMLFKDPEIWDGASTENVPMLMEYVRQITYQLGHMLPERMALVLAFIEKDNREPHLCEEFLNAAIVNKLPAEEEHGTFILSSE